MFDIKVLQQIHILTLSIVSSHFNVNKTKKTSVKFILKKKRYASYSKTIGSLKK